MGQIKSHTDIWGFWERGKDVPVEYRDMTTAMIKAGRYLYLVGGLVNSLEFLYAKMEEAAPDEQALEAAHDWLSVLWPGWETLLEKIPDWTVRLERI